MLYIKSGEITLGMDLCLQHNIVVTEEMAEHMTLDKDDSGTISEDEAVEIWEKLLDTFRRHIGDQLERLGAATRTSTVSALEV